ncbi:Thiol:disulfide interchange protein CycY [bacterium HR19]|nr:Thiol:disulfide interchange protein CycY [bacterium HR19]
MNRKSKVLIIVFSFLSGAIFFGLFLPGVFKSKRLFERTTLLGKTPPEFLLRVNGEKIKLSEIIEREKDKVIIINFFASWCTECREERKKLLELREKAKVIGVVFQDTEKNIRDYLEELNPYHFVYFDSGEVALDYGITGVPETFVVKDGKIIKKFIGPIEKEEIEKLISSQ